MEKFQIDNIIIMMENNIKEYKKYISECHNKITVEMLEKIVYFDTQVLIFFKEQRKIL